MLESSGKFQEVSTRKNIKIITLLRIMHNVKSLKITKIKTKYYIYIYWDSYYGGEILTNQTVEQSDSFQCFHNAYVRFYALE